MRKFIVENFLRLAVSGWVPRRLIAGPVPVVPPQRRKEGPLQLEIVSHCWRYSWLLTYQLSSLVLHPPEHLRVCMTVYFSPEDEPTRRVLDFFSTQLPPNVTWNWQPLEKERLFRRAIGRNQAALATTADWIWFTDCDQVFHRGCLDALARFLPGQTGALVYPRQVGCTQLLDLEDPVFQAVAAGPALVDIDPARFAPVTHTRAVGALQILRGDVARSTGYCNAIRFYHEPLTHWQKTFEDRTFRWLLGTQGEPIELPGLFRIEHARKGRKSFGSGSSSLSGQPGTRAAVTK
jgi:hypothetical protein